MPSLTPEEAEAKWVLLGNDLQTLRDLANGDRWHISRYAQDVFEELREHYGEAGN